MPSHWIQKQVAALKARQNDAAKMTQASPVYFHNFVNSLRHDVEYFNSQVGGEEVKIDEVTPTSATVSRGLRKVDLSIDPSTLVVIYTQSWNEEKGRIEAPVSDTGINYQPKGGYDPICERILGPLLSL